MHITAIIIVTYICCCLRIGTAPWRFFQLNARYFSKEQGIFSKLLMDKLIPEKWRLPQQLDNDAFIPTRYPVFLKPEWGQNAQGIYRVENYAELLAAREKVRPLEQKYIIQEGARGPREFEIFSIDIDKHDSKHDVLTITEAVNNTESFPINSKYNVHTRYADISSRFNDTEKTLLANYINDIGSFGISRLSVRAHSEQALLAGDFQVIELNLFLPMPINLLDSSFGWQVRLRFISRAMMSLAKATKAITPEQNPSAIFTRMMLYGRTRHLPQIAKLLETRRTLS